MLFKEYYIFFRWKKKKIASFKMLDIFTKKTFTFLSKQCQQQQIPFVSCPMNGYFFHGFDNL